MSWHAVQTLISVSRPSPAGRSWAEIEGARDAKNRNSVMPVKVFMDFSIDGIIAQPDLPGGRGRRLEVRGGVGLAEVLGKVIDDGLDFLVLRLGAVTDHFIDQLFPF